MGKSASIHHIAITNMFGTLKHIRSLTWPEVRKIWQNNEESLTHWQIYWEAQGYKSWEQWRKKFFWRFNTARANWALYEVNDPMVTIPCLKPGPFRGWRKLFYKNRNCLTFVSLVYNTSVANHPPVQQFKELLKTMEQTTIIGLYDPKSHHITVIEGMHRCAAYSVSVVGDRVALPIKFYIALGIGEERWLSRMLYKYNLI